MIFSRHRLWLTSGQAGPGTSTSTGVRWLPAALAGTPQEYRVVGRWRAAVVEVLQLPPAPHGLRRPYILTAAPGAGLWSRARHRRRRIGSSPSSLALRTGESIS